MSRPIVIAGGGTGGHVFVADAVAQALQGVGEPAGSLRFVGSRRGQERKLLAKSGVELRLLPGRGIQRSWSLRAIVDNLLAAAGLFIAVLSSVALIGRWRPRAVVSVGGYAAFPVGLAAAMWRRPLILVNVDAVPGMTHRLLSRAATASCVAFAGTELPAAVLTGAPVRPGFADIDRSLEGRQRARRALGCDPERPFVAVATGSLGSRSVNQAVADLASLWAERPVTIYQVTGRRDFDAMTAARRPSLDGGLEQHLTAFSDQMELLYSAADVAVTRAGALTIAELAVAGVPAVLVPLPGAPGDHQTANARALADAGGAVLLADDTLSASSLAEVLEPLLLETSQRRTMEERARSVGHPAAAHEVAAVIEAHVR